MASDQNVSCQFDGSRIPSFRNSTQTSSKQFGDASSKTCLRTNKSLVSALRKSASVSTSFDMTQISRASPFSRRTRKLFGKPTISQSTKSSLSSPISVSALSSGMQSIALCKAPITMSHSHKDSSFVKLDSLNSLSELFPPLPDILHDQNLPKSFELLVSINLLCNFDSQIKSWVFDRIYENDCDSDT